MERLKGDIFMATLQEVSNYLMEQGVVQAEINEIIDFYALIPSDYDLDEWKVNFVVDADDWLEENFNSKDIAFLDGNGDFIDYIKKEFLSDTAKVMYGFAEYLRDIDDPYMFYCKDTNRLIFFDA